jgi:acetyl esterase/lipase
MPIGYLIVTGGMAATALSAVLGHRPRRSSPFRPSYVFGLWLNWPLVSFLLLAASTALAIDQSGIDSPGLWVGLGLAIVASAALAILRRLAQTTGPALERALDEGLGADWRDSVDSELADRLRRRPSLARILVAPVSSRRRGVERIANIRYGPARRANLLDLYRDRSDRSGRPILVYLHPLFGSKRLGARHLLHRLAGQGWVCLSANYRRASGDGFSDPLIDVKKVIAWAREHGPEFGADPTVIFLAGSSLGGHLASLAAFTPGDPVLQPGFEDTDTSVAGVVSLYAYYGAVARGGPPTSRLAQASTNAPPCFVAHGDRDTLVPVEDPRGFVEQLRATSSNPVVYAELPGAQHGFDLFRSRRFDTVVDAIEAFTSHVRSRDRAVEPAGGARAGRQPLSLAVPHRRA